MTVLDAVYFDAKETKSIVAIVPKPPFRAVFQVAVTKEGSGIRLVNESEEIKSQAQSVFMVETREAPSLGRTRYIGMHYVKLRNDPNMENYLDLVHAH